MACCLFRSIACNQWWLIVCWTHRKKIKMFFQENTLWSCCLQGWRYLVPESNGLRDDMVVVISWVIFRYNFSGSCLSYIPLESCGHCTTALKGNGCHRPSVGCAVSLFCWLTHKRLGYFAVLKMVFTWKATGFFIVKMLLDNRYWISIVAADGLVLKHQAISSHNANQHLISPLGVL